MNLNRIGEKLAIFSVFFFGLALVLWPILGGQKIFNDYYVTNYAVGQTGYNFYKDFGDSLRKGHLQLWWSSYMGGFPVWLTQAGFFNPLGILFFGFLDYISAYNWLAFVNFLFAGLAMYWLIRNLKLSKSAAILAGFAWMLSFNNIQYGSIPVFSNVFLFIPLFFGSILKLFQGDKKFFAIGGLTAGFGLASGMTNVVFYTMIAGLLWALFLDWNGERKFFGRALKGFVSISFIGAVLASFWLLPVLNYLPFTLRGQAVSSSIFFDYLKIGDVLRFFYPFIQLPGFGGFSLLSGIANLYIGVIPFFLAVVSLFLWRRNRHIAFWAGLFIFAFSMRLRFFPFFQWIQYLPLFDKFRAPFHWYSIAIFSLTVLSAYGLDGIKEIKSSRAFGIFAKAAGIFAALNIFAAAVINATAKFFRPEILNSVFSYFDRHLYSPAKKYPADYYHKIITQVFDKSAASFSFSDYRFLISFIFVLAGCIVFIAYKKDYLNFENFKRLAVGLAILNLVLIWRGYYNFTPKELITNPPDTIQFIKNQKDSSGFRVFRFYPPEMYQQFGFYDVKNPLDYDIKTLGMQINPYWVDGFGGGEPFRSQRISDVLDAIGYATPSTYSKPVWIKSATSSLDFKIAHFSSPRNLAVLSMLNIKYVFSSFKLPNLNLIYQTTATEKNIPVYICENPSALKRIYFAKNVKFIDSNDALNELLKVKDFKALTLIECQKNCFQSDSRSSTVQILAFKPEYVKIKTSGNGGWLVYSDANLPTWTASIDNRMTNIHTANYLFKSVYVPKGEHIVIFEYPGLEGQFKYALKNIF